MRRLVLLSLVGLLAQLVDGSLGMGYGVTSATLLLAAGLGAGRGLGRRPPLRDRHVAGLGGGPPGARQHRLAHGGHPGGAGLRGAFAGATLLTNLDAAAARPAVAVLLLGLGTFVTWRYLTMGPRQRRFRTRPSARFLVPTGLVAGVLDAVGGGGWGPVGTTALLSSGRLEPRRVVGSVDTAEFVVSVGGSLGFLAALGRSGIAWPVVGALMLGGVLAAPLAALVVRLLAPRVLGVSAGGLIVLTNVVTLGDALDASGVTIGLGASVVFTLWVLWIAWAVKLEQEPVPGAGARDAHRRRRQQRGCGVVGGVGRVSASTNLTHWAHASLRQVRLRPARPDRDGHAQRTARAVSAEELGRLQEIPHGFLQAILADLRRAGIVMSPAWPVRRLADGPRRPRSVSVADVIRAVDGPLVWVYGLRPEAVSYNELRRGAPARLDRRPALACATSSSRSRSQQLAEGRLPDAVTSRTADEDAWQPH